MGTDDDDILIAPGPSPMQLYMEVADEVGAVYTAANNLIAAAEELMQYRAEQRTAHMGDWSGGFRDDFDSQFPASQAELSYIIDEAQRLKAKASGAAWDYANSAYGVGGHDCPVYV